MKPTAGRPPTKARTPLARWMAWQRITGEELAHVLQVTPSTISKWRLGRASPGRALAAKIERVTDGAVTVASWSST